MPYDARQDAVSQYRDALCDGLPHGDAIKAIEPRDGQDKDYYQLFFRTLVCLRKNGKLQTWWRHYHVPFKLRYPTPPKPAEPLPKRPKRTPEERREAIRAYQHTQYLKRKARKQNPNA